MSGRTVVLVCGGRDYRDEAAAFAFLDNLHKRRPFDLVIEGDADGADRLAKRWCFSRGVHCATVPALWSKRGRAAGPMRNLAMLKLKPDAVIAFPGGRGTENMKQIARDAGIPVVEGS